MTRVPPVCRTALLAVTLASLAAVAPSPPPSPPIPVAVAARVAPQAGPHVVHSGLVRTKNPSPNWTGYVVQSRDNRWTYFTRVYGSWTVLEVPNVYSNGQVQSSVSTWVGLGGYGTPVLWQAGTGPAVCQESDGSPQYDGTTWTDDVTSCTADGCVQTTYVYDNDAGDWQQAAQDSCDRYTFWYEDYGCRAPAPCPNAGYEVEVAAPSVSAGDRVDVQVTIGGQVTFSNETTGESATYTVPIDNNGVGLSAEWIAEQTCSMAPHCTHPINFEDAQFSDAYAYGTKMSAYVDSFNYRRVDLSQHGHLLARPSPLEPEVHGFDVFCC